MYICAYLYMYIYILRNRCVLCEASQTELKPKSPPFPHSANTSRGSDEEGRQAKWITKGVLAQRQAPWASERNQMAQTLSLPSSLPVGPEPQCYWNMILDGRDLDAFTWFHVCRQMEGFIPGSRKEITMESSCRNHAIPIHKNLYFLTRSTIRCLQLPGTEIAAASVGCGHWLFA